MFLFVNLSIDIGVANDIGMLWIFVISDFGHIFSNLSLALALILSFLLIIISCSFGYWFLFDLST